MQSPSPKAAETAPRQPDSARMPDVLCIGSVLWDIIGRCPGRLAPGADLPGRIQRLPGGVAANIAMTLARLGLRPGLISALGDDAEGAALAQACQALGLETGYLTFAADLPTDRYMAIEDAQGLIAAIADAHTLEAVGAAILAPLADGRLGSAAAPWQGLVALDGNLTTALLAEIAGSALFAGADLRIAPASPGKAERLLPLLAHPRATLYLNRLEAGVICGAEFASAEAAASALLARGARRVLVTDGGRDAADGQAGDGQADDGPAVICACPPSVEIRRVTGAGDTFMARHMVAETQGASRAQALSQALAAAAAFVAGKTDHD